MSVFLVTYPDNEDGTEILTTFSTEEKAKEFIEQCKKPFYLKGSIVRYDYRDIQKRLDIEEWELDEFKDYKRE